MQHLQLNDLINDLGSQRTTAVPPSLPPQAGPPLPMMPTREEGVIKLVDLLDRVGPIQRSQTRSRVPASRWPPAVLFPAYGTMPTRSLSEIQKDIDRDMAILQELFYPKKKVKSTRKN